MKQRPQLNPALQALVDGLLVPLLVEEYGKALQATKQFELDVEPNIECAVKENLFSGEKDE